MAYNSDGYIMIDFTEVDFRRTNQTIEGLYKRCVDVIGTNKFILVINANGRTPLPATCSFTNNQYVIDTVIYMFAVSSNDNLFIRRNDVPASDIIDDNSVSVDKTWSSNKIDTELNGKQDALTPVSPVSINADNEISVDLSGKQNVLTEGENITILNDVISSEPIKTFTYTGTGTAAHDIVFPQTPVFVLGIFGNVSGYKGVILPFYNGITYVGVNLYAALTNAPLSRTLNVTYPADKTINIEGSSENFSLNTNGNTYTVYYI